MAYRSIVVNMGNPLGQNRGRLAAALAHAQGAYLIGRHYTFEPRVPGGGSAHMPTSQMAPSTAGPAAAASPDPEQSRGAHQARDLFQEARQQHGVEGEFEALPGGSRPLWENLLDEARYADLTIVGKPGDKAEEKDVVKRLVQEAGGPVMVVPDSATTAPGTGHVLIAWNGSREAARAVRDALPLIEAAGRATVLMLKPKAEAEASAPRVQKLLERHGASCEIKRETAQMGVSEALISDATELSADVVVMGAYGRARLNELITGGATTGRTIANTTVPLLLAQ